MRPRSPTDKVACEIQKKLLSLHTVKSVYNDHPWYLKKLVAKLRWSEKRPEKN